MPIEDKQPHHDREIMDPPARLWPQGSAVPLRMVRSVRRTTARAAEMASRCSRGHRWLPIALAIGSLPLLIGYALGSAIHQTVSAAALTALALGLARQDAWIKGVAAITVAFLTHSVLAIVLARLDPTTAAAIMPGADWYWQKQITWIQTGQDPEYVVGAWLPAHLQLLGAMVALGVTSFGGLAFYEGFFEVDLMNFYNAQLLGYSADPFLALLLGWHIWSILRGIGYVFLSFELTSMSLQWISGVSLAPLKARCWRWGVGVFFLLADGVVKFIVIERVRNGLFGNLI